MKQEKRPTRKEKQAKFGTVENWLSGRRRKEKIRHKKAIALDREFRKDENA